MSKTVDERVVSMQFDNKNFESNVQTSLSTLDKLKKALKLDNVSSGLDTAGKSVDNLGKKFQEAEVYSTRAGFHFSDVWEKATRIVEYGIANRLVSAVKNLVKEFTITPISTGFQEYELKMGSVQTIMASTGESLETVNQYLKELNEYSDKTIYSFSDMTSNIGKFTNAGVKLEDAVAAIKGVSNEAAISGANANEASRAMYNFAQALSAGYVKLIDWKSIENANMATVGFKKALLESAVAMGTAEKSADGMYKVLTTNASGSTMDAAIDATHNFNDSLSYQWMTTEVLTQTLKQYATDIRDMTDAEIAAYEAQLKSLGYTEEQIKEIEELGKKASDAATEIKTFSMMMDTLKEAAQSGWAETWELILGDFNQAKALWTELGKTFGDAIGVIDKSRNDLIRGALVAENDGWEELCQKISDAGLATDDFQEAIIEAARNHGVKIDEMIEKEGSFIKTLKDGWLNGGIVADAINKILGREQQVTDATGELTDKLSVCQDLFDRMWKGDFDNGAENRIKAFEEMGKSADDYNAIQKLVNEHAAGYQLTLEDLQDVEIQGIEILSDLTDEELKRLGYTDEQIKALRELGEEAKKANSTFSNLIEVINGGSNKVSGRDLLIQSLRNTLEAISKILKTVKEAWDDVFDPISSDKIYSIIESFEKFTKSLIIGKENTDNLRNTFKLLFTVLKVVGKVLTTVGGACVKIAWNGFKLLATTLLSATSALWGFIKEGKKSISEYFEPVLPAIKNFIKSITEFVAKLKKAFGDAKKIIAEHFNEWKEKFEENESLQKIGNTISGAKDIISDALNKISEALDKVDFSKFTNGLVSVGDYFIGLADKLSKNKYIAYGIGLVSDAFSTLFDTLSELNFEFKLPEIDLDKFSNYAKRIGLTLEKVITSASTGTDKAKAKGKSVVPEAVLGGLSGFKERFLDVKKFNWDTLMGDTITKVSDYYIKFGDKIKAGLEKAKEVIAKVIEFVFETKKITMKDLMDLCDKILQLMVLYESFKLLRGAADIVDNLSEAIESVGKSLKNISKAAKFKALGAMFKSLAIAIGVLILSLVAIDHMGVQKAWRATGVLTVLLLAMGGVVAALGALVGKLDSGIGLISSVGSLLVIVITLALLVKTLKKIDDTDFKNLKKSISVLMSLLMSLVLSLALIGQSCKGMGITSAIAITTMLTAVKMVLDILETYAEYDWNSVKDAIPKLISMLLALSIALRVASGGVKKEANTSGLALLMITMMLSLKILIKVIQSLGEMDEGTLKRGITAAMMVLFGMSLCMTLLNSSSKIAEKEQRKVDSFTGMAIALIATCAAIYVLGKMDTEVLKKGLTCVSIVLALFSLVAYAFSKGGSSGLNTGTMLAMLVGLGILIGEIGFIAYKLAQLGYEEALGASASLILLLGALSGVFFALSKINIDNKKLLKKVFLLSCLGLVVAELGAVLIAMSKFEVNGPNAIGNVTALSELLLAMTGCMAILSKHTCKAKTIFKWVGGLAVLGLVVAELGAVLIAMSKFEVDGPNAIGNATALSEILLAMSGCMAILSSHTCKAKTVWKWVGGLAGLGLVVAIIGAVLGVMQHFGIDGIAAIHQATAISELLLAMAGCMKILSISKWNGTKNLAAAVGAMIVLGAVVGALAYIIYKMQGIDGEAAIPQVIALSILLAAMAGCMAICGFVGQLGLKAIGTGIAGLSIFIVALTVIIEILGWFGQMTGFQKALDAGIVVMRKLGQAIGEFIGGILGGIAGGVIEAISSTLPKLGQDLSAFAINATPFFVMVKALDASDLAGVAVLASAIGVLTGAAFVNGILNFFSVGHILPTLGNDLLGFMTGAMPFFMILKTIDEDMIKSADMLCDMLLSLTKAELLKSITGWIGGETDISAFASQLVEFGKCLVDFRDSVSDLSEDDLTKIDLAATAGKKMSEMAKNMPRKGGIYDHLFGENQFDVFGDNCVKFADCLISYAEKVRGFTEEDMTNVQRSANAGTAMSNLANNIPNDGGAAGWLFGENNIATFGRNIVTFGNCLMKYAENVRNLTDADVTAIQNSASATTDLAIAAGRIPNSGGATAWLFGDNNIETFGYNIVSYGKSLMSYAETVRDLTENDVSAIKLSKSATEALAEAAGAVPKTDKGLWGDIAGEKNILEFGEGMCALARAISSYSKSAKGLTKDDVKAIKDSKDCIEAMSDVADEVPKLKGKFNSVSGEYTDNIANFANGMISLGKSIKSYSAEVAGIDDDNVKAIKRSGTAIEAIGDAAKKIPNEGGLAGLLAGENDLTAFGDKMVLFGSSITSYAEQVSKITDKDVKAINNSADATEAMAKAAGKIANEGGIISWFTGDNSLSAFGNEMVSFAVSLFQYAIRLRNIKGDDVKAVMNSSDMIDELVKSANKIAGGSLEDIPSAVENLNLFVGALKNLSGLKELGLSDVVEELNKLGEVSMTTFLVSIVSAGPQISMAISDMINNMLRLMENARTSFISSTNQIMEGVTSGIREGRVSTASAMTSLIEEIVTIVISRKNLIVDAFGSTMSGISEAIKSNSSNVKNEFSNIVISALEAIGSKRGKFKEAGKHLCEGFANGIKTSISYVTLKVQSMIDSCVDVLNSYSVYSDFYDAGKYVAEGFAKGIDDGAFRAEIAARSMAKAAYDSARELLQINSPSKLFRKMASCVPEGFAQGITRNVDMVEGASKDMAMVAYNTTKDAMAKVVDIMNGSGIDQPTIRPVMDMSNMQLQMQTLDIGANLNVSISKPISSLAKVVADAQSNMDSSNRDITNAIESLRSDLSDLYSMVDAKDSNVYLDSKVMANKLAKPMNRELSNLARRGAY